MLGHHGKSIRLTCSAAIVALFLMGSDLQAQTGMTRGNPPANPFGSQTLNGNETTISPIWAINRQQRNLMQAMQRLQGQRSVNPLLLGQMQQEMMMLQMEKIQLQNRGVR